MTEGLDEMYQKAQKAEAAKDRGRPAQRKKGLDPALKEKLGQHEKLIAETHTAEQKRVKAEE